MRKATVNFVVDALALVAFVLLAGTGVLVRYVLPPGSGHFSSLWGMDRHAWGEVHFWISVVLLALLALHVFLHWRWVVSMVKGKSGESSGARLALAVVGVLMLGAIVAAPFLADVEQKDDGEPRHRMRSGDDASHDGHAGLRIEGSMTLAEVSAETGVPVEVIVRELGLPADTPVDSRLGRLRRTHGFEMEDVRAIVREHAGGQ